MDLDKYTDVSMAQLQLMFNSMPDSTTFKKRCSCSRREKKKKKKKKKKIFFFFTTFIIIVHEKQMPKAN
jgi:hypothetical protein